MNARISPGFDRVASFYDFLARIIYGKSIQLAQYNHLEHIPGRCRVLILGGGTGWLLVELLRIRPGCTVYYVETSGKMIALARKKIKEDERVHFIQGTIDDVHALSFDVIITNFFLDLFSPATMLTVVKKILKRANGPALWLVADFVNGGRWWHDLLLRMMYLFFHLVCQIEGRSLPPWEKILAESGAYVLDNGYFYGGFIKSIAYRTQDSHFLSEHASN